MAYGFFKHRALNAREQARLDEADRLIDMLGNRLGESAALPANTASARPGRMVADIAAALETGRPLKLVEMAWILSYVPSNRLESFAQLIDPGPEDPWYIRTVEHARADRLLEREHLVPDFQRYQRDGAPPKYALVCLTGHALRLNIPLQMFQLLAVERFDLLLYLRDETKRGFMSGIRGIASSLDGLARVIADQIPEAVPAAYLAVSSGGVAALRLAARSDAGRCVCFSSGPTYLDREAIDPERPLAPDRARLYFNRHNGMDREMARAWQARGFAGSIRWLDGTGHATLTEAAASNRLDRIFAWLDGSENNDEAAA